MYAAHMPVHVGLCQEKLKPAHGVTSIKQ